MSDLKAFYDGFSQAVQSLEPDAYPQELAPDNAHRFAIYRNNVHRGLCDALAAAYPTVEKLVGKAFFRELARQFVGAETSRPGSLALYGNGFSDFIAAHETVASLAYLTDIARLERARLEALNAKDAEPLSASHLAGYEDVLGAMQLHAHSACRLVVSDHPVLSIWTAQNVSDSPKNIVTQDETVLITRPYMDVKMKLLTRGQAAFSAAIFNDDCDVETACEIALAADSAFDITRGFADLLVCGAVDARIITDTGVSA
ncbi:putative DNA-binding domain-containing protein [Thalassospira lucentensis]|uniref:HvfC/BufC family peptide modification chaperone n=1 Tax=Thalassospira lucentensis TaxID=168935 RepID=UPI003D2F149E